MHKQNIKRLDTYTERVFAQRIETTRAKNEQGFWALSAEDCKKIIEDLESFDNLEFLKSSRLLFADALCLYGNLLRQISRYTDSEQALKRSLTIYHDEGLSDSAAAWKTKAGLAYLYCHLYQFEAAEALFEQTIAAQRRLLPACHEDIADSLDNQSAIFIKTGRLALAKDGLDESLKIRLSLFGEESAPVAFSLGGLSVYEQAMGAYAKSRELLHQALEIVQKVSPLHPYMAYALIQAASLDVWEGKKDDAEDHLLKAQNIFSERVGTETFAYASSLLSLGNYYTSLGRTKQAAIVLGRCLSILEKIFGPEHPALAGTVRLLSSAHLALKNLDRHTALQQRADYLERLSFLRKKEEGYQELQTLADMKLEEKRFDEAVALFAQSLDLVRKQMGAESLKEAEILRGLGAAYRGLDDYAAAESSYIQALVIRKKILGPDHPYVSQLMRLIGVCRQQLGDPDSAKSLRISAQEIEKKAGVEDMALRSIKLLQERKKNLLGEDHPSVTEDFSLLGMVAASIGEDRLSLEYFDAYASRRLSEYKPLWNKFARDVGAQSLNVFGHGLQTQAEHLAARIKENIPLEFSTRENILINVILSQAYLELARVEFGIDRVDNGLASAEHLALNREKIPAAVNKWMANYLLASIRPFLLEAGKDAVAGQIAEIARRIHEDGTEK
jgi:tetratricopeptide (TPR) repeat protein